jgi:Ni,Fe-hydrogenase I cytochrome b subunit
MGYESKYSPEIVKNPIAIAAQWAIFQMGYFQIALGLKLQSRGEKQPKIAAGLIWAIQTGLFFDLAGYVADMSPTCRVSQHNCRFWRRQPTGDRDILLCLTRHTLSV